VDGFKSYATRTTISGFDPSFNAITGLNGSGKSNILDSICFVLGISNLSQVRVANLQELVYKGGQAGTSKATVSIVFNNSDRDRSPVGYENCEKLTVTRQIVIGGRNKYLINGHVAQPGRVQNLFHSVQLNVNNPHFLIMQGRITKVISMKPPEVLAMIEEAAGTRMYEMKKEAALKTIEKKQRKVQEIEQVLATEITPMLDKLRADRSSYMKWCSNNSKLERLERLVTAFDYHLAVTKLSQAESQRQEMAQKMASVRKTQKELKDRVEQTDLELHRLTRLRDSSASGDYARLEQEVENQSKLLVKSTSAWTNCKENLQTEQENVCRSEKSLAESLAEKSTKEQELAQMSATISELRAAVHKLSKDENAAQKALLTGTSGDSGTGGGGDVVGSSVLDQIQAAKRGATCAETELEQLRVQMAHAREELREKGTMLRRSQATVEKMQREQSAKDRAIQQVKLKLHEVDYDAQGAKAALDKRNRERDELDSLRQRSDELSAKLSMFDFIYADPEPGFDRRRVKGFVGPLVSVKDSAYYTAVEIAAGGRLFQVVVDTDRTGKALLQKGKLQRRVTIIPLNKIDASLISRDQLRAARGIDPQVNVALSLVGHDDDVELAMKHVFGRTLICRDLELAKRVTFDPHVRSRTVTLDGDMFDPSGTLSGGSSARASGRTLLEQLSELQTVRSKLSDCERALAMTEKELSTFAAREREHRQLTSDLELQTHEAALVQQRLEQSSTGRLLMEVKKLESLVQTELPESRQRAQAQKATCEQRARELEESLHNVENARKVAMRQAEENLVDVKRRHAEMSAELRSTVELAERLELQIETLRDDIEQLQGAVQTQRGTLSKLQDRDQHLHDEVGNIRSRYETSKQGLEEERKRLAESDHNIGERRRQRDELVERAEIVVLDLKQLEHTQRSMAKDLDQSEELVATLEKNHRWILESKTLFGVSGGDFDFESLDMRATHRERSALSNEQQVLSKKINRKVMTLFEKAEQEYQDLTSKRRIIENDKRKMESVIAELDEKKKEALQVTWQKVNKDFASIFSTLLPGATAKLEPPEGQSVMEGLEIRVGFGAVWKDSLSELSGGQRSLIALSLVLAMLLFKPAPMYILDEIDAALDLSHTQNIGTMLKCHFSNSQFIVVSLKEGMFNNANVLFRTKFVDGVSTVTRTVSSSALKSTRGRTIGLAKRALTERGKENRAPDFVR